LKVSQTNTYEISIKRDCEKELRSKIEDRLQESVFPSNHVCAKSAEKPMTCFKIYGSIETVMISAKKREGYGFGVFLVILRLMTTRNSAANAKGIKYGSVAADRTWPLLFDVLVEVAGGDVSCP